MPPYFFTGQMPFLPPNQQCQSIEGPGDLITYKSYNFFDIICSEISGSRDENWQGLGCAVASTNSLSLLKMLAKKFPNASAFSESVLAVCSQHITIFMKSLDHQCGHGSDVYYLISMYFQDIFGFFLHCTATFLCSSFCNLQRKTRQLSAYYPPFRRNVPHIPFRTIPHFTFRIPHAVIQVPHFTNIHWPALVISPRLRLPLSSILIHLTVWPQYINVTDKQTGHTTVR